MYYLRFAWLNPVFWCCRFLTVSYILYDIAGVNGRTKLQFSTIFPKTAKYIYLFFQKNSRFFFNSAVHTCTIVFLSYLPDKENLDRHRDCACNGFVRPNYLVISLKQTHLFGNI